MKKAGQIVLFRFPQTDLTAGKLRPALLLGKIPGRFDDWLICMISTQLHQLNADFDEEIGQEAADFVKSGLKKKSIIRVGRLAVVEGDMLLGTIGQISEGRLKRIKDRLINWLSS